jgi:hypothetical protein
LATALPLLRHESVLSGYAPRSRPFLRRHVFFCAVDAERNRIPLPRAREHSAWNAHLASEAMRAERRCCCSHGCCCCSRHHPRRTRCYHCWTNGATTTRRSDVSTRSLYDEASRLTPLTVFCRCSAMHRAYFDNQRLSLLPVRIALARYIAVP